jgi:formylglycine-generating enzyme required for sulfatase activity
VSWNACVRVLRRLGLELPTEAQWERAARAGTDTPWWTGDQKSSLAETANLADACAKARGHPVSRHYEEDLDDGYWGHAPVGSLGANQFGLWDVIGNVAEWCGDPYVESYQQAQMAGDGRREASDARYYCMRGGSFGDVARDARSARRYWHTPGVTYNDVGCRPARRITR